MPTPTPWPSIDERRERGKKLRDSRPRSALAEWAPAPDRPDVVELMRREVVQRPAELLRLRWERMTASPFACFRGAVGVWAFDVGPRPAIGLDAQLCGDAHLLNLGAYSAPDGHLVFDLNDFDHTCRGPVEWDLQRLAVSIVLAGREASQRESACHDAVAGMVASYREAVGQFAEMSAIDVARFEISPASGRRPLAPIFARAARENAAKRFKKATAPDPDGGRAEFRDEPPILRRLTDADVDRVLVALSEYRTTLGAGRQQLLDAYRPHDVASRVQGVGSFGVSCWLVLLYGTGPDDPLFLQVKQVDACAWTPWLPALTPPHHGQRAAEGQARTQTVSDPFLGWTQVGDAQCLVRQWSDHKASCEVDTLTGRALEDYAELCGHVLAKAHARTGDAAALAGYCGTGDNLDVALARFALAYADQAEADHGRLIAASRAGALAPPTAAAAPASAR